MSIVNQGAAARESGGVSFHYPVLTGANYTSWAIKMEAVLDAQGVWEAVQPEDGLEVDARKDKAARAILLGVLPEEILLQVALKRTAKELWESLKTRYIGADRVRNARLQTLRSEFEALRMKEGETLDDFAYKVSGMSVKYAGLGGMLDDAAMVKKLLNTVPNRFYPVIAGIEQFCDLDAMPFEEAVGRLKAFEERTKQCSASSGGGDNQLLLTQAEWEARQKAKSGEPARRGRGPHSPGSSHHARSGRGRGESRGEHGGVPRRDAANRSGGGSWDKRHIKCFHCGKMGHYASECRSKTRAAEANLAQVEEEEPVLLMAASEGGFDAEEEPSPQPGGRTSQASNVWYFDNGASNHMTGDRDKFIDLKEYSQGSVRFGDGSTVKIKGKGTVMLCFKEGQRRLLSMVLYIPQLRTNIISCGQLAEGGSRIEMKGDHLLVFDSTGKLLIKVKSSMNRLYKAAIETSDPHCLLADRSHSAWLWHLRLGHVNFNSLRMLAEKKMAAGVPSITHPEGICKGCLEAKQTRQPFPVATNFRAKESLELLHIDLCGPITPSTFADNNYFMLIVDDHSRWMWEKMLKSKDEALGALKSVKQQAEIASGRRVKVIRSDRGGEFNSSEFTKFCEEAGIRRHLTAPYSPQQNGVVERRNRTVMEMARSLLQSMKVPSEMWGEAVRHAVYLLNRLPTRALGERTPFEVWIGRKPDLAHLKIFGCIAHAKVTEPHLRKLDHRSRELVYLGVEEGSKAHRLFDPEKKKLHISRDVVFDENREWTWGTEEGRGGSSGTFVEKVFSEHFLLSTERAEKRKKNQTNFGRL